MKYISTRGNVEPKGFIDTVLMGLADDGGLMVPSEIPVVSAATLEEWRSLSYQELFLKIFAYYTNDEIPLEDLQEMVNTSYGNFRTPEVTPIQQLNDSLYVLELFHGPTFAFKDVALQFMGELYSYISKKQNKIIHILGATSGILGRLPFRAFAEKKESRSVFFIPMVRLVKCRSCR